MSIFSSCTGSYVRRAACALAFLFTSAWVIGAASAQRLSVTSPRPVVRGKHCLGENSTKLLLNHYMAGSINPLGIGQTMRLGLCKPLIQKDGLLFDFTNVEAGLINMLSPTDVHGGVYINVTPLSILTLRAESTAYYIWPIPLQGAGFITVQAPEDFKLSVLSPDPYGSKPASRAVAVRGLLGATLQGAVPLGKRVDLIVVDSFGAEYVRTFSDGYSEDKYYYNARRDSILRRDGDWVLINTAVLLASINLHPNHTLRIGATDDLVYVPHNGYIGNIAAGLIAYSVKNLRDLAKAFSIFFRVGTFTNHAFRVGSGITLAAGLDVTYELFKRPTRRPDAVEAPVETPPAPAAEQAKQPDVSPPVPGASAAPASPSAPAVPAPVTPEPTKTAPGPEAR